MNKSTWCLRISEHC